MNNSYPDLSVLHLHFPWTRSFLFLYVFYNGWFFGVDTLGDIYEEDYHEPSIHCWFRKYLILSTWRPSWSISWNLEIRSLYNMVYMINGPSTISEKIIYHMMVGSSGAIWTPRIWVHKKKRTVGGDVNFCLMTSSNGNTFRVTGHLCRELTGPRWIPHTKASDADARRFLWSAPEETVEQTILGLVIWDAIAFIMTSL